MSVQIKKYTTDLAMFFTRYIKDENDEIHGIGWKIWGVLGVGPETGYAITPKSAVLILQKEILKCLFAKIFENDRVVRDEFQACLELPVLEVRIIFGTA